MYGQDNGGGNVGPDMKTIGFGQDSYQTPADNYVLGTTGTGQEMRPELGSLSNFAMQRPGDWYLDPQARGTPEAREAFTSEFQKGPANPKSWWDWAQHVQKFYGIGSVAKLAGDGWFDRFNMSPEEQDQLGRHIQQQQDGSDDPLFGNTGLTIPKALMMLGSAAVGGAGGWAAGGTEGVAAGSAGADAVSGGVGIDAMSGGASMPPAIPEGGLMPPANPGAGLMPSAMPETAGTLTDWGLTESTPGVFGGGGIDPDVNSLGLQAGSFDPGGELFGSPGFSSGEFAPSDMGLPGYGYTPSPNAPGWEEYFKRLRSGMGTVGSGLSIGSGLYGIYSANKMRKTAEAAGKDPLAAERAGYAKDLADLRANPERLANLPGYKAGLQAVERKMASQGYLGSGNMMDALFQQGGHMYDAEQTRLARLAGFDFAPPNRGAAVTGSAAANDTLSKSLASLGFGAMSLLRG